ncbi:MAG: DUF2807 domain-containing protein [Bacteroidales bacterium]|nr:DUF2807 domain-containing protein [Bacteroidales bacterium]
MKLISIFISAVFAICGCCVVNGLSGIMETSVLEVPSEYTSIEVSNSISVKWSTDATAAVLTADKDVIPYVKVELSGNTLKIYIADSCCRFMRGVGKVDVCLPAVQKLDCVKLSGASSFSSETPLTAESLWIGASGASAFNADIVASEKVSVNLSGASKAVSVIEASELDIDASGASYAKVSGKVPVFSVNVSGASKVSSGNERVSAGDVTCSVSGASSLYVNCTAKIDGDVSGASKVRFGDAGAVSTLSASGASSVSAD